jgi:hypothetical protein
MPLKYLGFPISSKRLGVKAFRGLGGENEEKTTTIGRKTSDFRG